MNTEVTVATENANQVAIAGGDPYLAYAASAAGGDKDILKFRKGRFFHGIDEDEVPIGSRLVANMPDLKAGWIRWWDSKPSEEVLVRIADGEAPPKRTELGDDDRDKWETDDHGVPRDPWALTNVLPLKNADTGDEFAFSTSSRGGIGAIAGLAESFGKEYRQKPGQLPIIELKADSYAHSNKAYGRIDVPVLELVDWVAEAELTGAAETTDAAECDQGDADAKTQF